jgi:hypothetical protein
LRIHLFHHFTKILQFPLYMISPFSVLLLFLGCTLATAETLRPPSVPLVTHDPYFSIWSPADKLTDAATVHWTGKPNRLTSLVRIDGKAFRLMGAEPSALPALPQAGLEVLPTRTIYTFDGTGVQLTLTFITPALPDDLDLLARPVTYLVFTARATDGATHEVAFYQDAAAELAVNDPPQQVDCSKPGTAALEVVRIASHEQPVLAKKGDDLRIDWGAFYLAVPKEAGNSALLLHATIARDTFAAGGEFPMVKMTMPQAAQDAPVAVVVLGAAKVGPQPISRWLMLAYDYAPHDLGTYPHATGQVYGMDGKDGDRMPVEESGNMLIMLAALAKQQGHADLSKPYWPMLTKWADYLVKEGLDPQNQLCSADMFGHLPRNANLALKAIIGIGGFSQLCEMTGKPGEAKKYLQIARDYAAKWQELAKDNGHTRLAYDAPDTWSMKHNLVWDRVLGLGLIPQAIADAEISWYLKVQKKFGLPVDHRTDTCLIDWALWSIAPARAAADFQALLEPIWHYANETPSRVPLADWFVTTDAKQKAFQARPVVGGIFIRMLTDPLTWRKWAGTVPNNQNP